MSENQAAPTNTDDIIETAEGSIGYEELPGEGDSPYDHRPPAGDEDIPPESQGDVKDGGRIEADDTPPDGADQIPPQLRQRAVSAGFSPEAIGMVNPVMLEQMVTGLEARLRPPGQHQPPAPAAGEPQGGEKPGDDKPFEFDKKFEEEIDELVVTEFKRLKEYYDGRIQALQAQVQPVIEQTRERSVREHTNWFDKQIAGLGEAFQGVFGKGDVQAILNQPQYLQARQALNEMFFTIKQAMPVLDDETAFQRAVGAMVPEAVKRSAVSDVARKARQQKGARVARPRSRGADVTTGGDEASAAKFAESWYKDHGI